MIVYKFFISLFRSKLEFRYLIIGTLNTLFAFGIFPLFYILLRPIISSYEVILIIAYIATSLFSFLMQKYLVFRSSGSHVAEFCKFIFLQFIIYILNLIFLNKILDSYNIDIIYLQIIFTLFIFVLSFIWNKWLTFRVLR